jgi:hypothetical protein
VALAGTAVVAEELILVGLRARVELWEPCHGLLQFLEGVLRFPMDGGVQAEAGSLAMLRGVPLPRGQGPKQLRAGGGADPVGHTYLWIRGESEEHPLAGM